jgi:large subunit ribosomal protein L30
MNNDGNASLKTEEDMSTKVKITLVKGQVGVPRKLRKVLTGLGLRKTNRSVIRQDNPSIRGMIFKVKHMVEVTEVESE